MNCKVISMLVVLLAVISPAQAISCYQCSTFDVSTATVAQQTVAGELLTLLASTACDVNSVASACADGTACTNLDMSSKLGGDSGNTTYSVAVQACTGTSTTASSICIGIESIAPTGVTLESCSAVDCETDGCNSGFSVSFNLVLLFSALLAALRM